MKTLKQLREAKTSSRAHSIITSKLKLMDYLKKGGITPREQPDVDKAHAEIDKELHDKFGKRSEEK